MKVSPALGSLVVTSPAGTDYRVTDGEGREIAQGAGGELKLAVDPGIYAVEWHSAGERSETLLRVSAGSEPATATFASALTSPSQTSLAEIAPRVAESIGGEANPASHRDSAIIVVLKPLSERSGGLDDIGLLNEREAVMVPDEGRALPTDLSQNERGRYYSVPPGVYLLSFRSLTGETVQQTIPALPGRSTLVHLTERKTSLLVASGDKFEAKEQVGCDPAQTAMISLTGSESGLRVGERIRLCRVLVNDLINGSGSIDKGFVAILDDPESDPLLRLFAAIVTIERLKKKQSPEPGMTWPKSSTSARKTWAERALRWLEMDKGVTIPDETVARWQLAELLKRKVRSQRRILRPPMLTLSWRWAIAQSNTNQDALPLTPANIAAARSAISLEPWLCWLASAAKAGPNRAATVAKDEANRLASAVAEKVQGLADSMSSNQPNTQNLDKRVQLNDLLSVMSSSAANAVAQIASSSSAGNTVGAGDLALKLGIPAAALAGRLVRTTQELDAAIAQLEPLGNLPSRKEIPPLRRPITVQDDPQKGRFGGQPDFGGFVLMAKFAPTRSPDWTWIRIEVTGPGESGEEVQFHLHDSFRPPMMRSQFRRKLARIEVTAWGGFTVGVWLPARSIQLELDLAGLDAAPGIVRSR